MLFLKMKFLNKNKKLVNYDRKSKFFMKVIVIKKNRLQIEAGNKSGINCLLD